MKRSAAVGRGMQAKGSGGVRSRSLAPPRNTTEEPLHPRVPSAAWSPFRLVLLIARGVFHLSTKQVESSTNLGSKNLELMVLRVLPSGRELGPGLPGPSSVPQSLRGGASREGQGILRPGAPRENSTCSIAQWRESSNPDSSTYLLRDLRQVT